MSSPVQIPLFRSNSGSWSPSSANSNGNSSASHASSRSMILSRLPPPRPRSVSQVDVNISSSAYMVGSPQKPQSPLFKQIQRSGLWVNSPALTVPQYQLLELILHAPKKSDYMLMQFAKEICEHIKSPFAYFHESRMICVLHRNNTINLVEIGGLLMNMMWLAKIEGKYVSGNFEPGDCKFTGTLKDAMKPIGDYFDTEKVSQCSDLIDIPVIDKPPATIEAMNAMLDLQEDEP